MSFVNPVDIIGTFQCRGEDWHMTFDSIKSSYGLMDAGGEIRFESEQEFGESLAHSIVLAMELAYASGVSRGRSLERRDVRARLLGLEPEVSK